MKKISLIIIISLLAVFLSSCYYAGYQTSNENVYRPLPEPPESYVKLNLSLQPITYNHTVASDQMAVTNDGAAWFWGYQDRLASPEWNIEMRDYLGDTHVEYIETPVKVMDNAIAVYGLRNNRYILLEDKSLWGWGSNKFGELGDGTFEPRHEPIKIMDNVKMASTNSDNQIAILLEDGKLYWCGLHSWVYDPNDSTTWEDIKTAVPELVLEDVIYFTHDRDTLLAIKKDKSIWGWSRNESGQLGFGDKPSGSAPGKPIKIRDNVEKAWCSGYGDYIFLLDSKKTLWGAGHNAFGTIGCGSTSWDISEFQPILEDVVDFDAGGHSAVALTSDGRVWVWGSNQFGDLGIGFDTVLDVNHPVYLMDQVVKVYATTAIKDDGSLWGWGYNDTDGTPIKIDTNVHSVWGFGASAYLKNDGTLWNCEVDDNGERKPVLLMENVRLPS